MGAQPTEKDTLIATLKATVFDCRQKDRNYQKLYEVFTELSHKKTALNTQGQANHDSSKQHLCQISTDTKSLVREVDELRAIQFEQ